MSVSYNYISVSDLDEILHKSKRILFISYILYSGLIDLHFSLHLINLPIDLKLSKSEHNAFW